MTEQHPLTKETCNTIATDECGSVYYSYADVITDKEVVRYSSILGYSPATSELKEAIKQQKEGN
jgi:hypothetical protein